MPTLVNMHIPKTGGTSFRQWLIDYFAGDVFLHVNRDRSDNVDRAGAPHSDTFVDRGNETLGYPFTPTSADIRDYFAEHSASGLEPFKAIIGHFTYDYPFVQALRRPILACSLVRDPMERIVSRYNWVRLNKNHKQRSCVEGRTLFQSLQADGPFLKSSINIQIDYVLGKKRSNCDWTIVCNIRRADLLVERLDAIYGRTMLPFPHRNRVVRPYREDVEAQPDFADAVDLVKSLNAEEIDFVASIGDMKEFNRPV